MSFASFNLHPTISETLTELKITTPTQIQSLSLPLSLAHSSIVGIAKTGQGKTLAFAIPIIQQLLTQKTPFFALVLAPTRELALQISEIFAKFTPSTGLRTAVLTGGSSISTQQIQLGQSPHVIIGTPGRVLDHFANSRGIKFANFKFLVLDECDRLLEMDFEADILQIARKLPQNRQNLLFSATFGQKIKNLTRNVARDAKIVNSIIDENTNQTLKQTLIACQLHEKINFLAALIERINGKIIIFCNKISDITKLFYCLKQLSFSVCQVHGQLQQSERNASIQAFKGSSRILISSDVAARGIDIFDVSGVINFDVPSRADDYVHRVGRTARAGKSGISVVLVSPTEVSGFQAIERQIGVKMSKFDDLRGVVEEMRERVRNAVQEGEIERKAVEKGQKADQM